MKRSKAYREADSKIDKSALYSPSEAVKLAKETSPTKFDATVEVGFRLGVDPRKADEAREAGADSVGTDDMIERIQGGFLDFDAVVATPDMMGKVGRLGRVLGPRGLMPNPKTGTVTTNVAKAVTEIKGGKIEFRVDRHGNLHFIIGKTSFGEQQLVENYAAALDEILRLKPSAAKGRYIKKGTLSTTMGPGIPLDPNITRNLTAEFESTPAS
jgi:large subunit ribosomal protein L1